MLKEVLQGQQSKLHNIQGILERSGHLNILENVKFDKKLPSNNLVAKSRSLSHTSQRTLQLLLGSFFVKINGFQNIQVSRSFWYILYNLYNKKQRQKLLP